MELPRNWQGATPVDDLMSLEMQLLMFDRIRDLLILNALPPTPPIYDLLWRYLTVNHHELAYAVDLAMTTHSFDAAKAIKLHDTHCASKLT